MRKRGIEVSLCKGTCGRVLISLLLAISTGGVVNAQSVGSYETGRVSASSSGVDWDQTWSCRKIRGYEPQPETVQQYTVVFQEPQLDELGNNCSIHGKLNHLTKNNESMGVNWFQGISVILAMTPERRPDWSNEIEPDHVMYEVTILESDGTFRVEFDLRETQRDPVLKQEFQIGVALAEHDQVGKENGSQSVTWSSADSALPATVQMISIPASAEIAPELRLIDLASEWPFSDPDGRKLIRAVNALQPLGKEKALEMLSVYVSSSNDSYGDGEIVFWIIRLLFEPVDLQQQIPGPAIAVYLTQGDNEREQLEIANAWPLKPMVLVDGVPLMVGERAFGSGVPEHPTSHIRWAEKFGVIREAPLSPTGNPLVAAEQLMNSKKFLALKENRLSDPVLRIRIQAFAMLGLTEGKDVYWMEIKGREWMGRLNSEYGRFLWDADQQEFVLPRDKD